MNTMTSGDIRVLTEAELETVSGGGFWGNLCTAIGNGFIALGTFLNSIGK